MRRHALLFATLLCGSACAQIAGFEDLTARKADEGQAGSAGGSSAAGTTSNAGTAANQGNATNGGALGVSGTAPSDEPTAGDGTSDGGSGGSGQGGGGATGVGGDVTSGGSGTAGVGGSAGSGGSPPVIGDCNVNLLRNPDFEAGATVWDYVAKNVPLDLSDLIVQDTNTKLVSAGVTPKAGHYLAWLGGAVNEDGGSRTDILQQVQIPAKTTKLVVSGWLLVKTAEPATSTPYDHFEFTLDDDLDGQWFFHTWWVNGAQAAAPDKLGEWFSFSKELDPDYLPAIRGRLLTFVADAQADSENETSYWLDSLSLVATCPR